MIAAVLTTTIFSTQFGTSLTFSPSIPTSSIVQHQHQHKHQHQHQHQHQPPLNYQSPTPLFSLSTTDTITSSTDDESTDPSIIPPFVTSTVLKKVYPSIVRHVQQYGNPNIPLGSKDGKHCKTLRRMAFQERLSVEEIEHLTDMGFVWNGFEGVYEEADFDDCLARLLRYEEEFQTNYQIPKKYKPDPELGAWVTVIRRIGRTNIEPERRDKLDAIHFAWKSTRKCGSVFMNTYQTLRSRLVSCCEPSEPVPSGDDENAGVGASGGAVTWEVIDPDGLEEILGEEAVRTWIRKQKIAMEEGTLSEARCTYMDQLPGLDWRLWEC